MIREIYDISGMHCAACSSAIERVLLRNKNVNIVMVSLPKERLTIEYDNSSLSSQDIIDIIKKAGFEANIHRKELSIKDNVDELKKVKFLLICKIIFSIPIIFVIINHFLGNHSFLLFNNIYIDRIIQFFSTFIVLILGKEFFINGFKSLISKVPTMDTLIAISTGVSFLYSSISMFGHFDSKIYFDSSVMIMVMVSIGKYLESIAKKKTSKAIEELINIRPNTITIIRNNEHISIDIDKAIVGDKMLVKPGEIIALDGKIIRGATFIDESILTGESLPVNKAIGDTVVGGSINKEGSIEVEITHIGDDTVLSRIIELIDNAQSSKAPISTLADRVSVFFVPVVIALAIVSALIWYVSGATLSFSIIIFVSVLVIACPCALGLATPMAIVVAAGSAARKGILIKDAKVLQMLQDVDTLVFDKTGTLTTGEVKVDDVYLYGKYSKEEFLNICASVERNSEHVLAKAIINEATNFYDITEVKTIVGNGIVGEVNKDGIKKVLIGNEHLLLERNIDINVDRNEIEKILVSAITPIFVAINGKFEGIIAVKDVLLSESVEVINKLNFKGIDTIMLTGDNEITARYIANELGISKVYANMKPKDKYKVIKKLRNEGHIVSMVGDGINDSISLAEADVAIAVAKGTDIAIETADIILMKNNLLHILDAINISKKTIQNIKQNLFWAMFYNMIGLPLAMGIFYIFGGPLLNPMFGCIAMSLSSLFVVTNALRLRSV